MNIMYSIVTDGPDVEPIDLEDIGKLHIKIDSSDLEDDLLAIYIQAAREIIEGRTNRSFITQSRRIKLDQFPSCGYITLTHGPVQTLTSVKYYDANEVEQTLSSSEYWVDLDTPIPRIIVKNSWPETYCRPNAVTIDYVAGYGDNADDVPAPLRSAILMRFAQLYQNRQSTILGALATEVPKGEDDLISMYILTQDVSYESFHWPTGPTY